MNVRNTASNSRHIARKAPIRLAYICGALSFFLGSLVSLASPDSELVLVDFDYDAVALRTDAGATAPFDPQQHRLINLLEITMGSWAPLSASIDPFDGAFASTGGFVRIDIVFEGLVNPPGSTDPVTFDPFKYGPDPVFGFVEIDMDESNETGGELDAPQFRYLGNIARFGGEPSSSRFGDRIAEDDSAFDGDFTTDPFVERHGEEFHIAFLGSVFAPIDIVENTGDGDLFFEADEEWVIGAPWFHRAHGFEPFSVAAGGAVPGEYAPECQLRFRHDSANNRTQVSLVFPLTNIAAAQMLGQPPQTNNNDPSDQASVEEAFDDLVLSAAIINMFPTGDPAEALITGWKDQTPSEHLEPESWRLTALFGTSYTASGEQFVWTDAYPNVTRGDMNGTNGFDSIDHLEMADFISDHDLDDGVPDGQVVIAQFASNFSLFDINQDGVVNGLDDALISMEGDVDLDNDVDLRDFAEIQRCHGETGVVTTPCALVDLDRDRDIDGADYRRFAAFLLGPGS